MSKILIVSETGYIMACPDNEQLKTYQGYEKFDLVSFGLPMALNVRVPTANFFGTTVKSFGQILPFGGLAPDVKTIGKWQDVGMNAEDILESYIIDMQLQNDALISSLLKEFKKHLHTIKVEANGALLFPKTTRVKYDPLDKNNTSYDKYFVQSAAFNQETNDKIKNYTNAYFLHLSVGEQLLLEVKAKIPNKFKFYTMSYKNPSTGKRLELSLDELAESLFIKPRHASHAKIIKSWCDKFKNQPNYLISLKGKPLQNEAEESIKSMAFVDRWKTFGDVYLNVQISLASQNIGFIKKLEVSGGKTKKLARVGNSITNNPQEIASIHFDEKTALRASKSLSVNSLSTGAVAHYKDGLLMGLICDSPISAKKKEVEDMNVIIEKIKIENSLSLTPNKKVNSKNSKNGTENTNAFKI